MAQAETARLIAELTLKDKMSAGVKSATKSIDKLDKRMANIGKSANQGVKNAVRNFEKLGLLAGGAVAVGIAKSVDAAGDFEAALNTINTVAQTTPAKLKDIGDGIRSLSRETGTGVDDLTAAFYDLVSAGIKTADAQNVLTQANKLAIGGLSTTSEAVDLLTTAINSYGGDAKNAAKFTNMFAEAIAAGKTTASDLAVSFAQVGPLAAKFGIGLDEIAAAAGVMTATGTGTAEAFTQVRSAMIALQKPSASLAKLQKDTGRNFEKLAKKKGLAFAYNEMAKAAKKAGIPMVKLTGRIEGANFAAQVTGENYAKYAAELDKVRHSSDGAGVAQKQMEQRTKGFNFAMTKLKANVHDAAITIGSELLPQFADLASEATGWLQGHQPEIKQFAKDLADGIRDAVKWARTLNWEAIGSGLKIAAGAAKGIATAFANMPPWIQGAVISGWGLNKLTGGALSDIVGELGKGLIKGVLGMNAGVVNINAGVVNGGGGPASGIPGAVAGAGGAAGGIGGIGIAALATTVAALVAAPVVIAAVGLAIADQTGGAAARGRAGTASARHVPDSNNRGLRDLNRITGAVSKLPSSLEAGVRMLGPAISKALLNKKGVGVPAAVGGFKGTPKTDASRESNRIFAVVAKGKDIDKVANLAGKIADDTRSWGSKNQTAAIQVRDTVNRTSGNETAATRSGAATVAGAVRASRPIVTTNVKVYVTAAKVESSQTTQTRYGPGNGSAGGGSHPGGGGP